MVEFQIDQAFVGDLFEQVGKGTVAVIALAEARVNSADDLLEHRAPDRVVVLFDGEKNLDDSFVSFVFS